MVPRTLRRVRVVCSRYNVYFSGGNDISTDGLKKSSHSRSQIDGVGKFVQRAIQPHSAIRFGRKACESEKRKIRRSNVFWRELHPQTKRRSIWELNFALSIVSFCLRDSHTRWVRVNFCCNFKLNANFD